MHSRRLLFLQVFHNLDFYPCLFRPIILALFASFQNGKSTTSTWFFSSVFAWHCIGSSFLSSFEPIVVWADSASASWQASS